MSPTFTATESRPGGDRGVGVGIETISKVGSAYICRNMHFIYLVMYMKGQHIYMHMYAYKCM